MQFAAFSASYSIICNSINNDKEDFYNVPFFTLTGAQPGRVTTGNAKHLNTCGVLNNYFSFAGMPSKRVLLELRLFVDILMKQISEKVFFLMNSLTSFRDHTWNKMALTLQMLSQVKD